jgi:hypothetical protein
MGGASWGIGPGIARRASGRRRRAEQPHVVPLDHDAGFAIGAGAHRVFWRGIRPNSLTRSTSAQLAILPRLRSMRVARSLPVR